KEGDGVSFTVVNDSTETWEGNIAYGAFDTHGVAIINDVALHRVGPNTAEAYGAGKRWSFIEECGLDRTGAFALLYDREGRTVAQHRMFFARFGELNLVRDPKIEVNLEKGQLTLRSAVFCWGVCLDVDGELPLADNCFDLLPGVPYTLPWDASVLGEPRIVRL